MLHVQQLTTYYGTKKAIHNISFDVKKGEILAIIGKNGAGKTTIIESVLGVVPTLGTVEMLNQKHPFNQALFERVGVQFQLGAYPENMRVDELIVQTKALYKYPNDFESLLAVLDLKPHLHKYVKALSGGERQKLFVLLALIPKPDIVFFDELTTGLDTLARRDIMAYLLKLKASGMTMVLTSHAMEEVEKLADKLIFLKDGNAAYYGSVDTFKALTAAQTLEDAYITFVKEDVHD